mgnify:CR=1 FL=1
MTDDLAIGSTLRVELDESSIRESRKTLESELTADPIPVEVEPPRKPGSAAASFNSDAGGGGRSGDIRGREMAMQRQHLAESNDIAAEQSTTLLKISDDFDENLDLNTRRNELLEDIKDASEATEQNIRSRGLRGLGAAGLGITIGLAGVSGLVSTLQNFTWPDLPEFPELEPPPLPIEEPPRIPFDGPDVLPFDGPDVLPFDGPESLPFAGPESLPFGGPDVLPFGGPDELPFGGPEELGYSGPLEIGLAIPEVLPDSLPQPGPLQTPDFDVPVDARDVGLGALGAGGAGVVGKILSDLPKPSSGAVGSGIGFPAPGALVAETAGQAQRKTSNERNPIERALSNLVGNNLGSGRTAAATGVATASIAGGDQGSGRDQSGQGSTRSQPRVDFNPTYQLDTSELERQVQSDVQELRRRYDQLERSIRGRR